MAGFLPVQPVAKAGENDGHADLGVPPASPAPAAGRCEDCCELYNALQRAISALNLPVNFRTPEGIKSYDLPAQLGELTRRFQSKWGLTREQVIAAVPVRKESGSGG